VQISQWMYRTAQRSQTCNKRAGQLHLMVTYLTYQCYSEDSLNSYEPHLITSKVNAKPCQ
jgi:hypothetical protein